MRTKLIALEVVLLVVFAGFYVWSLQQEPNRTQVGTSENQPVFANLNVSKIKTIELQGGDEQVVLRKVSDQQQTGQQAGGNSQQKQRAATSVQPTMDKGPYRADYDPEWVVASYHNYGIKGDQVQNRIIKPLRQLKRGTVQARQKSNLKEFGLDKSNRRRIVLKDESNNVIREVVLGKRVTGFTEAGPGQFGGGGNEQESIYYYNASTQEDFEIRLGQSGFSELPLDPQEWVNKEILSYDQEDVPLVALKTNDQLYVLRRNENQGAQDGENQSSSTEGGSSDSGPQWQLFSGDYYADGLLPRNAPVLWENKQLKWKGRGGQVQSIPLTKRKLKQSKAESLASTLSSLSADEVSAPISVPAKQQAIPAEKKAKYGFDSPETVLYLGEWRKPNQLMVFRARFHVGKTSDNGEDVYISSLKTRNMAQQVIRTITGLGGQFGGSQAEQLIPVYSLSSSDRSTIVSPGDLIEEEKEGGQNQQQEGTEQDTGSDESGDSTTGNALNGESNEQQGQTDSGTSSDGSGEDADSEQSTDGSGDDGTSGNGE